MKNLFIQILIVFSIFTAIQVHSQNNTIKWIKMQEALTLQKKTPKPIIIDVYTDWCGWCKVMDKNTFSDPNIISYINANYYAVKFDAEGSDTVIYKGQKYFPGQFNPQRPDKRYTHPFALLLTNNRPSYPTITYLNDTAALIAPMPGYKAPDKLQPELVFFAENLYKFINYEQFLTDFQKTFHDTTFVKPEITWATVQEAMQLSLLSDKKLLIFLTVPWSMTGKIMEKVIFNNSVIAKKINDNFTPVLFNALSKDTLVFSNYTFVNEGKEHPFHQFAVMLLNGKMQFPAMIYMSSKFELISAVPGYFDTRSVEPIISFFGTEAYKTKKYDEFIKTFTSDIK
ncbi:MAG: DUF255 domain-containing protein [Bacteroidales bacterium]